MPAKITSLTTEGGAARDVRTFTCTNYSAGFTYDARGNRTTKSVGGASTPRTFGYDAFSRMTGCTNGSTTVSYTYDAVGRKVKRLKRDATIYPDSTYYVYDGLDPVCMVEFNPAHTECTTVTWLTRGLGVAPGIGNIVAQQRYTINFNGTAGTSVTHYYHPNHRGDTAYLTDASGVKVATYVYDAFGRMLTDSPATLTDYRFSGKEWDPDAQLYYFGFRWYDPDTGTWTTKDPLGIGRGGYNCYMFCSNNGMHRVDSYGLLDIRTPFPGDWAFTIKGTSISIYSWKAYNDPATLVHEHEHQELNEDTNTYSDIMQETLAFQAELDFLLKQMEAGCTVDDNWIKTLQFHLTFPEAMTNYVN